MQKRHHQFQTFRSIGAFFIFLATVWRFCFEFLLNLGGMLADRALDSVANVFRLPRRPYLDPTLRFPLSWLQRSWFAIRIRQARQRSRRKRWWNKHFSLESLDRFFGQFRIRPNQWRKWGRLAASGFLSCLLVSTQTILLNLLFPQPAQATTTLAIEPITWDFVGLDSNKPETQGPDVYVTGARVCNIGTTPATNVKIKFFKDGIDNGFSFINLQGTDTLSIDTLPDSTVTGAIGGSYVFDVANVGAGIQKSKYTISETPPNCYDAYFNFEVTRTSSAHHTYQRYYIEASADNFTGTVQTPRPRQIYIEQILSQSRNYIYDFTCNGSTGAIAVSVGDIFSCTAKAHTATAYPQLSFTADFPNLIFQTLRVSTTYSNPSGGVNSTVYADGCGWVQNPTDPRYHRSSSNCEGESGGNGDVYYDQYPINSTNGKVGNDIQTTYEIKVLGTGPGNPPNTTIDVTNIILDFSGGSYHYNADLGSGINLMTITVNQPGPMNLQVTKSHEGNFTLGSNQYRIDIEELSGTDAVADVVFTDTLPTGYSFATTPLSNITDDGDTSNDTDADDWSCVTSGQTITCTYDPDQDSEGESFPKTGDSDRISSFYLNVEVSASAATNSTNVATIAGNDSQTDSNTSNNTDTDPTTIQSGADLQITKTHTDPFTVGTPATYTLTVTNNGDLDADPNITVVDTLPTGLTFDSASFTAPTGDAFDTAWTCSSAGQLVTCTNTNTMVVGETTDITIPVNVTSSAIPSGTSATVTNIATISSPTTEPNTSNNTARDDTTVNLPLPDLTITKDDGGVTFVETGRSKYTITVTNDASASAPVTNTIQVRDTLPAQLTYQSFEGTGWSCVTNCTAGNAGPVTFQTNTPLNPGDSTSFTVTVNVLSGAAAASPMTNTVDVDPSNTISEISEVNNQAQDTSTAIVAPNNPQQIDLYVNKTAVLAGNQVTYTIVVSRQNDGAGQAEAVVLTDVVPSELTNVTVASCVASGQNQCVTNNSVGNNISYNLSIRKNQPTAVTLTITGDLVDTVSAQQFDNTVSVTHTNGALTELSPADNSDTAQVTFADVDLEVVKTPDGATFTEGLESSYTLTVNNRGSTSTLDVIRVVDTLPAQFDFVSASSAAGSSGWVCTFNSPDITCINNQVLDAFGGANDSSAIEVVVKPQAGSSAFSPVTNSVIVSTTGDTDATNDSDSVTTNIDTSDANLTISKTAATTFGIGNQETYTLQVNNTGSTDAALAPITITDTLPPGIQYLSSTGADWICSATNDADGDTVDDGFQTVTCNRTTDLAAGANSSVTLQVFVSSTTNITQDEGCTLPAVTNYSTCNQASVTTFGPESSTADNSTELGVNVLNSSDLAISKTAVGSFINNQTGTYQITITNNGLADYDGDIVFTDALNANFTFVDAGSGGDGFTCDDGAGGAGATVTCTLTDDNVAADTNYEITAGQTLTVTLPVTVGAAASGNITNIAEITSGTLTTANDPTDEDGDGTPDASDAITDTNDRDDDTIAIQAQDADLAITKTDEGRSFTIGTTGTYLMTVTNNGPATAGNDVVITDALPSDLTFNSSLGLDWDCSASSGSSISCFYDPNQDGTGDDMPSGTTSAVAIEVNVGSATPTISDISNTATVSSPTPDSNSSNDSSTDTTNIDQQADLEIIKSAATTTVNVGDPYTYNLRIINNGPGDSVADIYVTDYLPDGVVFAGATSFPTTDWVLQSGTDGDSDITFRYIGNSGVMVSGADITLDVPVTFQGSVEASVDNIVRVSGVTGEPDNPDEQICDRTSTPPFATNNCDIFTTTVTGGSQADLAIVKLHQGLADDAGRTVDFNTDFVYELQVTNTGADAEGVSISDPLPDGLELQSIDSISPGTGTITGVGTPQNRFCGANPLNGEITCNLFNVTQAEGTVIIRFTVRATAIGVTGTQTFTNTATVTSDTFDPDTSNNTESEDVTIQNITGSTISGRVFNDVNTNTNSDGGSETGIAGIIVELYDDANNNDQVDSGETLLATATTDSSGDYTFTLGADFGTNPQDFALQVDTTTLPLGATFTTDNAEEASFTASPSTDSGNDFGYQVAAVTIDFGDAPATYDAAGSAQHLTVTGLRLGSTVDGETTNAPTVNADGDGADEDAIADVTVSFPTLNDGMGGQTYTVSNINVTNSTGSTAYLSGWIDFDRNGTFDADERSSTAIVPSDSSNPRSFSLNFTVPSDISAVNPIYARLRLSNTRSEVETAATGNATSGEVEDYRLDPIEAGNLLFVKRITAVRGAATNTIWVDDTDNTTGRAADDNDPNWPTDKNIYLRGTLSENDLEPGVTLPAGYQAGDEVEYTVYFLSNGGSPIRDVKFCDLIPGGMTYVPNSIKLGYDTGTLANPVTNAGVTALTDTIGDGSGAFYDPGIETTSTPNALPGICVPSDIGGAANNRANPGNDGDPRTNDTGAVFVQIVDASTDMPYATGAGTPPGSYGFVRFRVTVD